MVKESFSGDVLDTLQRRLDLLKLEGDGFATLEIVKALSTKYECSARAIYYDLARRASWQPQAQGFVDAHKLLLKILNRLEQIYRKAGFKYVQTQDERVQLGALKIMLDSTARMGDMALVVDLEQRIKALEEKAQGE